MDKIKENIKEKIKSNLEYLGLLNVSFSSVFSLKMDENNDNNIKYYENLYENVIIDFLNIFLNFIKNIIFLIIVFLNKILLLIDYINENDVLKNIKSNIITNTNNDKK